MDYAMALLLKWSLQLICWCVLAMLPMLLVLAVMK